MGFDIGKRGLEMFFRPWHVVALKVVRDSPNGATPATVWKQVHQETKISRASVLSFLERLAEEGTLERWEETGRGGYPDVYRLSLSETLLREHLAERILRKIQEFPETIKNVLIELTN